MGGCARVSRCVGVGEFVMVDEHEKVGEFVKAGRCVNVGEFDR